MKRTTAILKDLARDRQLAIKLVEKHKKGEAFTELEMHNLVYGYDYATEKALDNFLKREEIPK